MTRCAVFDLDDTLYEFVPLHDSAAGRVRLRFQELFPGVSSAAWDDACGRAFAWQFSASHPADASRHSRGIRFQRALERLGLPPFRGAELEAVYWTALLERMVPARGAQAALARLKERGVRIGVGTNMTAYWQLRKIEKLGLGAFVDFVVSSEEAGAEKPAPAFFATVAEKAGVPPAECVFVGDNIDIDAKAAAAAGMRGVWLEPDAAKRAAHPEVESVASLDALEV